MKQITGKLAFVLAILSLGLMLYTPSMASTRSPRHGQQTVDVSGGPADPAEPHASSKHHMQNAPMMEMDGMENMTHCSKMMRERESAGSPAHSAMGHRSDMHTQMHGKMRQCMEKMHSGGMGMGN